MEIEWQPLLPTTGSPAALIGAAATLESMAAEAGATGDRVSGILHSGVPDFSSLLGPPIMNRSSEHGIMARSVQRLLSYAASVSHAWAEDVARYIAESNQILAEREGYQAALVTARPVSESNAIMLLNKRTLDLVEWFENQARLRGQQLRDGPTPDRLSELGRAHEHHGLAARVWESWEPPPLQLDGADMPALVRRWQDGDATPPEAEAAAEWYADYRQWREQLLAGGRYLNADDLEAVRRYEGALAATGLAAAVVAGRLSTRGGQGSEFRGWKKEVTSGGQKEDPPLPLAEQLGPSFDLEVGGTKTLFEHSDEREAEYRSQQDFRREWFADGSLKGFGGFTGDGIAGRLTGAAEAGVVKGAEPVSWLPGPIEYQALTVGAIGTIDVSAETDRAGVAVGGELEATLAKASTEVTREFGPVTARLEGEVGAGAGATAKGDAYVENGKLVLDGKLGAKLIAGLKVGGGLEVDLKELADMVTPEDRPAGGGGGSGGSF